MKKANGLLIKSASAVSAVLLLAGTASAQFPGTNGRLIFTTIGGNVNGKHMGTGVFTVKQDKSGLHQFSFPFANTGLDYSASYSPDGTKVAYVGEYVSGNGNWDILVKNADDTGTVTRITSDPGIDIHPRWSPDGSKIVFTRSTSGDHEVYVANADGSGGEVVRTTSAAGQGQYGVFTPDGTKIVFIRGGGINTVNATGAAEAGNTVVLAVGSGINAIRLDVSPDGTKVAFINFDSSVYSGRLVPITGGTPSTILSAQNGIQPNYLAYSPDGTKIAVGATRDGSNPNIAGNIELYDVGTGQITGNAFQFDDSNGSISSLTWGTNNATLSDNIGSSNFNTTDDTTGLPNTASTFFKNPSNWIPTLLAGGSVLALAIYSRKWFKREFANKKR